MSAKFGPAGTGDSFKALGYKTRKKKSRTDKFILKRVN